MDNLITCERCGSDACHTQETTPEITNYFCFGCGFTTNSIMKTGEEFFEKQKNMLPELYKDLIEPDKNDLMWMPSMVNVPNKGMIFANGTDKNNWKWAAVRSVKVKEEEKTKYPIPGKKNKYYEYRMDMTTMLPFEEKNYMDALSYIDILPE